VKDNIALLAATKIEKKIDNKINYLRNKKMISLKKKKKYYKAITKPKNELKMQNKIREAEMQKEFEKNFTVLKKILPL
jgi:hypothetical protein